MLLLRTNGSANFKLMENKLRNNLTLLFLLFFSTIAFTQPTFQKKFRISSYCYSEYAQQTFDGGYIVFGYERDCWLIKLNANGDTIWTKSYSTSVSSSDVLYSAQQTSDSGFIFAGCTYGVTPHNTNVYLVKTNSLGDTLWSKTYGHSVECIAYSVKQTNDGGYIVCGSASGAWRDFFLLRTNSFGDTLWTKQFNSTAYGDKIGYSVIQTYDNGFIFCGSRYLDIAIVKTDSTGNITWSKIIPNSGQGNSIIQTLDSGYIIGANLNNDFGLLKISSVGDIIWAKSIGNTHSDYCKSIRQTSDGGIIGAGATCLNDSGNCKILIVKTNMYGDTIFTRVIGSPWHSGNRASSINETSDKGFIIGGWTDGFGGGNNFYCIKVDSLGYSQCNELTIPVAVNTPIIQTSNYQFLNSITTWNLYPTVTYINGGCSDTTLCTSVGINEIAMANSFLVSPNPSSGNFIISFEAMIVKGNVEILNILGENIFSENIFNEAEKKIYLKNISHGIYFAKVFDGAKYYCKKIIVEQN